jgi:hypothetical protein
MTEIPVMAESALTIAPFCLPLFRIFEAHRGSNILKGGKQKYRQDQKKTPHVAFSNVVSAGRPIACKLHAKLQCHERTRIRLKKSNMFGQCLRGCSFSCTAHKKQVPVWILT